MNAEPPPLPSIGHVVFYVRDVAAATAFYRAAFGFPLVREGLGGRYAELATGTNVLALVATDAMGDYLGVAPLPPKLGQPGHGHVTLDLPDAGAALAGALAHGASLLAAPADMPWGKRVAFLATPDGHLLELSSPV